MLSCTTGTSGTTILEIGEGRIATSLPSFFSCYSLFPCIFNHFPFSPQFRKVIYFNRLFEKYECLGSIGDKGGIQVIGLFLSFPTVRFPHTLYRGGVLWFY